MTIKSISYFIRKNDLQSDSYFVRYCYNDTNCCYLTFQIQITSRNFFHNEKVISLTYWLMNMLHSVHNIVQQTIYFQE